MTATTDELAVDDTAWIVTKLGEDVLPEQDKRELTENAVQATVRALAGAAPPRSGEVLWDVDGVFHAATGVRKLCVVDNGDAFDAASFRANIMHLAPRGKGHDRLTNYGVGAKIAGVTRHPAGMVYQSWCGPDEGILAQLWRDPGTGRYGLRRHEVDDGTYEAIVPIDGADRPDLASPSGTKVTLLGRDHDEDTFAPPAGNPHGGKWLSRYLNTRYFALPDGVRVRVREGDGYVPGCPETGRLRTITGQRAWLDAHATDAGVAVLTDARVWWWILPAGPTRRKDSHYATGGLVAAKFIHELFDLKEGRAAPSLLQKFGVTFGVDRVVLVVEPGVTCADADAPVDPDDASVDLQRAHVKHHGRPLDWDRYTAEFRRAMPEPIRQLVEEASAGTGNDADRRRRYRAAMERIRDLFVLPRYRPTVDGDTPADPHTVGPGGAGHTGRGPAGPHGRYDRDPAGRSPTGRGGNVYPLRRRPDGPPAREVDDLPDVDFRWVSDVDPALPDRAGQMEDRAARYVPETNTLLINADFRLFELVGDYWQAVYYDRPAVERVTVEAVRDIYTGILVETVVGMLAFRGAQQWSDRRLAGALSEEALTAAVMPRVAPTRQIGAILRGHFPGAA